MSQEENNHLKCARLKIHGLPSNLQGWVLASELLDCPICIGIRVSILWRFGAALALLGVSTFSLPAFFPSTAIIWAFFLLFLDFGLLFHLQAGAV